MQLRQVKAFDALPELTDSARRLLRDQQNFFLTEEWFDLLLRHGLPAGTVPRIYAVAQPGSELADGLLFGVPGRGSYGFAGRQLLSLSNFYSMAFAPILRPAIEDAQAVMDALVDAILRERPRWSIIELRNLIAEDPTTAALERSFRRAGLPVETYFQFENWYHPTSGMSGQAYFASRSSQLRNTVTRKLKKASKEHRLLFHLYRSMDELTQGLCDFQEVYRQSWKEPELHPEFIPGLLRTSAAQGALRLGVLYLDGAPAAAQIWLVTGGRAVIYKLAYDEKYAALSVGSILTKWMFDEVLDRDQVSEVDYGVGSEPYKRDWMSARRTVIGLVAFNPCSVGGLAALAVNRVGQIKKRLRLRTGKQSAVKNRLALIFRLFEAPGRFRRGPG